MARVWEIAVFYATIIEKYSTFGRKYFSFSNKRVNSERPGWAWAGDDKGSQKKARLFENFSILTETLNKCFNFQYVLFQIKGL